MASEPGQPTFHRGRQSSAAERSGYLALSMQPLHVLVFLLPLVIFYEMGSAIWLAQPSGASEEIRARRLLAELFDAFGMQGLYIPGILLVAILFIWHLLIRDPWRVRPRVLGGMAAEAVVWTVPLLVLGQLLYRLLVGELAPAATALASAPAFADHGVGARTTIAIGAGLYEELLFRMLGIAVVHAIIVDLAGMRESVGRIVAVLATAVAFALYHDSGSAAQFIYFTAAGLYFGAVYVMRGFGLVVAVHALYDVVVLLMPASA